jgi:hypothetical protein
MGVLCCKKNNGKKQPEIHFEIKISEDVIIIQLKDDKDD